MNKKLSLLGLAVMTLLFACKKDDKPADTTKHYSNGLFVLSEGGFNNNNAALAFYDPTSKVVTTNLFASVNKRNLGDVANDIGIYGGKMYIVMNGSNTVEIIDAHTGKSLSQLSVSGASPRQLAFANGKVYVTTWASKILEIDTTTNAISQSIACRSGAEGIVIANNKMYVSIPGVYPASNDTIVSVIDMSTFKETKTIVVGPNPNLLRKDNYNHLYVVCAGNYDNITASLATINLTNDQLISNDASVQADNMAINGNTAYLYKTTYTDDSQQPVMKYDVQNMQLLPGNFITDGTKFTFYYGITADATTGDVYVIDAFNTKSATSKVVCFNSAGVKKFEFTLADYGYLASKIVFLR